MIFTGVKSITIPEGVVSRILLGDTVLWKKPSAFKNWLPYATDTDNNVIYGGDYNGDGKPDGYKTGTRLSSSGSTSTAGALMCACGFIPATDGAKIYIKGMRPASGTSAYIITYNTAKTKLKNVTILQMNDSSDWAKTQNQGVSYANGVLCATLDSAYFGTGIAYVRTSGIMDDNTIISVNEEIPV